MPRVYNISTYVIVHSKLGCTPNDFVLSLSQYSCINTAASRLNPQISRCAAYRKGAIRTTPPRGFPTHLWTHLPAGLSAPFRPRAWQMSVRSQRAHSPAPRLAASAAFVFVADVAGALPAIAAVRDVPRAAVVADFEALLAARYSSHRLAFFGAGYPRGSCSEVGSWRRQIKDMRHH